MVISEMDLATRQLQAPFPAEHTKLHRASVMLSLPTRKVWNVSGVEQHVHAADALNVTLKITATKCQKLQKSKHL